MIYEGSLMLIDQNWQYVFEILALRSGKTSIELSQNKRKENMY